LPDLSISGVDYPVDAGKGPVVDKKRKEQECREY